MKKFALILTIFFLFSVLCLGFCTAFAKEETKREPLEKRMENYIEIKDELKLNDRELDNFYNISEMERQMVRPIALKLEANLLRLDELNEIKCRWYQKQCKRELKKNKAFIADDIKELKRQIRQKKEYYKILYINQTTRKQDLELRNIIKEKTQNKPQMW